MCNLLLDRGYKVRIACREPKPTLRQRLGKLKRAFSESGSDASGFLHEFTGEIVKFQDLNEVSFAEGETVIAVGTYSVKQVRELRAPVNKIRFNHGFPAKPSREDDEAWRGKMTTITVSGTLVPRLNQLTEGSVWGVVPNGIDLESYHIDENIGRTGIGLLYSRHPNKAPEDLIAVLQEAYQAHPETPQHVFGTEQKPGGIAHVNYTQLPPVDEARAIYNRCKVWVVTSKTEGLPGVVFEAMACGCVVISSDNDGSLEIIKDGENGLIVPTGDRAAFAAAIKRVLEDEVLQAKLVAGAQETARAFSWPKAADKMEKFLNEQKV